MGPTVRKVNRRNEGAAASSESRSAEVMPGASWMSAGAELLSVETEDAITGLVDAPASMFVVIAEFGVAALPAVDPWDDVAVMSGEGSEGVVT